MNKEIIEEYDILLDTINLIKQDEHYKDSIKYLDGFLMFLSTWKEEYLKENTLLNIDPAKLKYWQLKTTDFFIKYEEYDIECDNCYTEILSYHYNKLLKYWELEFKKD